jgi:hypothetical protein
MRASAAWKTVVVLASLGVAGVPLAGSELGSGDSPKRDASAFQAANPRELIEPAVQMLAPPASLRRIEAVVRRGEVTERWIAHQAIRGISGERSTALVVIHPEELRGTALIARQRLGRRPTVWSYDSKTGKRSRIARFDPSKPLFGSDLALEDLGLLDLSQRSWSLLGGADLEDIPTYMFAEKAPGARGRASDAITDWVAVDDGTLLRREIRSPDDELRKTVVYDSVSEVEGIFVPSFSRVADRRGGGTTDLHVRDVRYDVHVPKSLFDPRKIRGLEDHQAWSYLSEPTFEVVEPEAH